MGIKTSGGLIVMKAGKLACSCCGGGGCEECADDVASTYSLTTILGILPGTIVLQQTGLCEWTWIGDAQSSVDYDALGPDTIRLFCDAFCTGIPGWNINFDPWYFGGFIACYDDDPTSEYPTGDYNSGDFTVA